MEAFARLCYALEKTLEERRALRLLDAYLDETPEPDAVWAVALLCSRGPSRTLTTARLRELYLDWSGDPEWLFDLSQEHAGDVAETVALLAAQLVPGDFPPLVVCLTELQPARAALSSDELAAQLPEDWARLSRPAAYVWHKLLTGRQVARNCRPLVAKALAARTGQTEAYVAARLADDWRPEPGAISALKTVRPAVRELPPFPPADPLEDETELAAPDAYLTEWDYEGIRLWLQRTDDGLLLRAPRAALPPGAVPELNELAEALPVGAQLGGALVAAAPAPKSRLRERLAREKPTARDRKEAPLRFLAYELLASPEQTLVEKPLAERRERLEAFAAGLGGLLETTPLLGWATAADRRCLLSEARAAGARGLLYKPADSPLIPGRTTERWLWEAAPPLEIDAVLLYAERTGRGPGHDELTFAVWQDDETLLPFAKVPNTLPDELAGEMEQYFRKATKERFGPVRSLEPRFAFTVAFDNIYPAPRRKCGVALLRPRLSGAAYATDIARAGTEKQLLSFLSVKTGG